MSNKHISVEEYKSLTDYDMVLESTLDKLEVRDLILILTDISILYQVRDAVGDYLIDVFKLAKETDIVDEEKVKKYLNLTEKEQMLSNNLNSLHAKELIYLLIKLSVSERVREKIVNAVNYEIEKSLQNNPEIEDSTNETEVISLLQFKSLNRKEQSSYATYACMDITDLISLLIDNDIQMETKKSIANYIITEAIEYDGNDDNSNNSIQMYLKLPNEKKQSEEVLSSLRSRDLFLLLLETNLTSEIKSMIYKETLTRISDDSVQLDESFEEPISDLNNEPPENLPNNDRDNISSEGGKYIYKMVQIPPDITVASRSSTGRDAADYLEKVVNTWANKGWEFYRVDELGVVSTPGCLGSLFGHKESHCVYYVVTFRKERNT